jgi:hypothetical protein
VGRTTPGVREQTQALRKFPSCPCVFKSERRTEGGGYREARVGRGNNRAADPPPQRICHAAGASNAESHQKRLAACMRLMLEVLRS